MNRHSRRALIAAMIALAVLAGIGLYNGGIKPNLWPKRLGIVEKGKVYRAGQLSPAAFNEAHERYGIRTIIDLGSTIHNDPVGERRNQRTADALGITRYVMYLYGDATGNPNYYVQALRLAADPANQPVLVHCGAGTERTGLFSVLYRHMHQGVPLEEALKEAESYGYNPKRTPQFRQMLEKYGKTIISHAERGGQIETSDVPRLPEPRPGSPLDRTTATSR